MNTITEKAIEEANKKGINKAIDLLVDKFIVDKLDKIINKPQDIEIINDLLREYLNKKYEFNKYMNTIVFQKETKTIDELYIPLTIVQNGKKNNNRVIIDENLKTNEEVILSIKDVLDNQYEYRIEFEVDYNKNSSLIKGFSEIVQ